MYKRQGLIGLGWDKEDHALTQEQTACLAEINGERKLFQDIPLNTNLCYGNPKIRTMLVDAIADYAEEHQNVSLLHFWLADDYNNQCECELCRDTIPTDFFIMMLNELDEKPVSYTHLDVYKRQPQACAAKVRLTNTMDFTNLEDYLSIHYELKRLGERLDLSLIHI